MFVCPRPTVQNILLVVLIIAILFSIKDSFLKHLKGNEEFFRTNFDGLNPDNTNNSTNDTNRELMLVQMVSISSVCGIQEMIYKGHYFRNNRDGDPFIRRLFRLLRYIQTKLKLVN